MTSGSKCKLQNVCVVLAVMKAHSINNMHAVSLHVAMVNGTKQKDIPYFFDQMPRLLFSLLFVSLRLLLKGCVYFFEKLEYIDGWIGYVRAIQ